MNLLYDIIEALLAYWQAKLGPEIKIDLAFRDERYATKENRSYPLVTLQVISTPIDSSRALSCPEVIAEINEEEGTARIEKPPVPINLEFQLDPFSQKQTEAWEISEKVLRVLGGRKRELITTTAGRDFFIMPLSGAIDPAQFDEKTTLWRAAYRFYVEAWLTSEEYTEIKIVLRRDFAINIDSIKDPEG